MANAGAAANVVAEVLKNAALAVIDAGALRVIADSAELKTMLSERVVLTPHPGEMAGLLGCSVEQVLKDRVKAARQAAMEWSVWLVLKGARSIIASPRGDIWINSAATEALATAGSGDVLSGVIAAFLARGLAMKQAVCAAVFVHGAAGECLARAFGGVQGILAGDIARAVSLVINYFALERGSVIKNPLVTRVFPEVFAYEEIDCRSLISRTNG
jgi:NAD(P)H-hydrate epimerase